MNTKVTHSKDQTESQNEWKYCMSRQISSMDQISKFKAPADNILNLVNSSTTE